jgi:hypothetical protein
MEQESESEDTVKSSTTKPRMYMSRDTGTFEDIMYCDVCKKKYAYAQCDKCGESVCNSDGDCCIIFPHYNNTEFIICNFCMTEADKKIKPYIENLRTLKQNIKNNKIHKKDSSTDSNNGNKTSHLYYVSET